MNNLVDDFKKAFNAALFDQGVIGVEAGNAKKDMFEEESDSGRKSPYDFLNNKKDMGDILKLVKNKKLSANKIKAGIKEFLKNPEELKEFLQSILNSRGKKEENKEAMSTGGMSGTFEPAISFNTKKVETKEATSTGFGIYDAPGFEDVKMRGNHTRGRGRSFKKTQLPGGKFVEVKKKCKRFPYCNQGDINALRIFENENIKSTIKKMSMKYGLSEDYIQEIILKEIKINNKL
jgi:ribosomal protein L34E